MADDSVQEDSDGQGNYPFMVRHARVWSRASTVVQFNWSRAAVRYTML